MTNDKQIEEVARVLCRQAYDSDCIADWPDFIEDAKEAIEASHAKFVPELVKAINTCIEENLHLADGDNCTLIRLKQALANLPEELRG